MAVMLNIACKLPHGLTLQVDDDARRITLRGSNSREAVAGYGFTLVDQNFFNAWKEQVSPDFAPLKNHMIFESKTLAEAKDEAAEISADVVTGFEKTVPKDEGVEPTEEMAAALKAEKLKK